MKRLTLALLALSLAGCGHFLTPLGTATPTSEKTAQQQDQDRSYCTDQSRASVENPSQMSAAFVSGLTIVGTPGTIGYLQATRKAVFKACMEQKNYVVVQ